MIYHVYANQSNVGDWLSAQGIQSLLPPLPVSEHFCDHPFAAHTLSVLSRATCDDFIIIGGGGLFMDYFQSFWEGFRRIAPRVPFMIWGVGCCERKRHDSSLPFELIAEIIDRSRLCIVRDALTCDYLAAAALFPSVVCPTVIAVPETKGEKRQLLHVDHYDNVGGEIYAQMVKVAERFAHRTKRTYRQTNNLIPSGHRGALAQTLDLYTSADLVLTSRLHGCIIALALGRPVLVVSGDRKIESFMEAAGLRDWVCDLEEVGDLEARLQQLPTQPSRQDFIEEGRRNNRRVAARLAEMLHPLEKVPA